MTVASRAVAAAVDLAERRRVPDSWIRWGIRRAVAARLSREQRADPLDRRDFWERAASGPIAILPDVANAQHYEVPAAFFDLVLGRRRKYSAGWWPEGVEGLEAAEEAMLAITAERAGIADGDSILDLGCGWGSFTLWAAERFPSSQIVGVSNSAGQRAHILERASASGLDNVEVVTGDVNHYQPGNTFRRIVSVEMLEHVRNHPELLRRMRSWLTDDGSVLIHVFAHRRYAYPYEPGGPGSWMANTFFTGGVMPSRGLIPRSAEPWFDLAGDWWFDGDHYAETLEAWLRRLDARADEARALLAPAYGPDTDRWVQRWRIFFMACAELFGFAGGTEWGVAHHVLVPR